MKAANRNELEVRDLATALYRDHRDYLLVIARRHAANERHAEEALQEAFISFLRVFDPDQGAWPSAWTRFTTSASRVRPAAPSSVPSRTSAPPTSRSPRWWRGEGDDPLPHAADDFRAGS
jgi:hypothetical protein